jgi:hypothetical protein
MERIDGFNFDDVAGMKTPVSTPRRSCAQR